MLVKDGEVVQPHTAVARALLPGALQTVKLADKLGVEAKDAESQSRIKVGEEVEKGQIIAETKGFLGKFKQQVVSDFTGTVDSISGVTGNMLVREAPIPVEIDAYVEGKIVDILPDEGAIVETRCAMVQGIFGVGGERTGVVRVAVSDPQKPLEASDIKDSDAGKFLVGGSGVTADALAKAGTSGVAGIITGGVRDADLIKLLGYDIGVAITGQENIPFTLVVTEGFGFLAMAARTFELLKSLEGRPASINGATQIRAGVIRPEIIVPLAADTATSTGTRQSFELTIGTPIRVIREPYFGQLGTVTELPSQLVVVDSGTEVRVLKAKLADARDVVVPRANVEIIAN